MGYSKISEKEIAQADALTLEVYTIKQVAYIFSVTERTVNNWMKEGKLKGKKIGGKWRFTKEELERFVKAD